MSSTLITRSVDTVEGQCVDAMPGARRRRLALFALLSALLLLLPIWIVQFPPVIDYPNLLARTFVLSHLHDPAFHFSREFSSQWKPYPYLALDSLLIFLQQMLPAEVAGKVLLSICVLIIPAGVWFFLRAVAPRQQAMAVWGLLLAYNTFFLMGFLNFQLSVGVCCFALGAWIRFIRLASVRRWIAAVLLMTLLYFTHLMGFGIAGLVVMGYCAVKRCGWARTLLSGIMFLPGTGLYLALRAGTTGGSAIVYRAWSEKFLGLTAIQRGYSNWVDAFCLLALLACMVVAVWKNRELQLDRAWLGLSCALFGLYWVFPLAYGPGWDADKRILPFIFILALAAVYAGRRNRVLFIAAVLLFLLRTASVTWQFRAQQHQLSAIAESFSSIPRDARVLPMVQAREDRQIFRSYLHFWAYGLIRRGWFTPYLFTSPSVQPLRTTDPAYAPTGFWSYHYRKPLDWSRIDSDYDFLWAYDVPQFSRQLAASGDLIFQTQRLQVYKIRHSQEAVVPARSHRWPQTLGSAASGAKRLTR